jgi:ribosomal-protein-alanine N-acetyltransferase
MSQILNFPDVVPELQGDLVYLREVTEQDIPAWYARATDAESARLAGDAIPESLAKGTQGLGRIRERFRAHTGTRWAIMLKGTNQTVGSIGLAIPTPDQPIAEIGAVVARAFWGGGIGTSAAQMVIRFAFDTLAVSEIRAELLQSNVASIRVLEKLGFRLSSVIPDFENSDAGCEDGYRYVVSQLAQHDPVGH